MISRRNYAIIAILMLIIFGLFQFSEVAKNAGNDYSTNKNLDVKYASNNQWQGIEVNIDKNPSDAKWESNDYVLFLGDKDTEVGSIVSQWTRYTRRNLLVSSKLSKFSIDNFKKPEFLLIDSDYVDYSKDTDALVELSKAGVSMVFCTLPSPEVIAGNKTLMELLGISQVREYRTKVEGIKLFGGFLFGGETIYQPQKESEEKRQDLELIVPWYITAGATKTYMVGLMDDYFKDYTYKNDFFPALIWRNSLSENSQVFCVVGDYMKTTAGIGILSAMIYELSDYLLYPVVNAQNTLLVGYPLLANENDENINSIYTRSYDAFQSGVAWPSLISLAEKYKLKYTCLLAPKYNYSDPSQPALEQYEPYLSALNEREAEIGLSLLHDDSVSLLDKVNADNGYYSRLEKRYVSTSAFLDMDDKGSLVKALQDTFTKNIRTVACDEDVSVPILSYLTQDVTLQSLTSNTENFTYSKDLMLKSVETALGYDNAKLDFTSIAWPVDDSDHWENIYEDMSSSLATFWEPFRAFDRTTLSESDQRVRVFLNIETESERVDDEIKLKVSGREDQTCYFVLRTHGYDLEEASEGVTFVKIEDNAYLLTINADEVNLKLSNSLDID